MLRSRQAVTKPVVSKFLSAPTLLRCSPGRAPNIASAASGSAVPLASVSRVSTSQLAAVFHQHVAQIGRNRFLLVRLGKQLGIRISGAGVGLVTALVPLEIHLRVAAAARTGRRRTILRHEALVRGPGTDQRAVDAEMLVGQQLVFL